MLFIVPAAYYVANLFVLAKQMLANIVNSTIDFRQCTLTSCQHIEPESSYVPTKVVQSRGQSSFVVV